MTGYTFNAALIDYDELFPPLAWIKADMDRRGIGWSAGQHRTPEAALEAARTADVVLVQSVRPLLIRPVIDRLEKCRCIARLGVGYDSVDIAAATAHGIPVCNVPAYCTQDVADHALALLLDSARHISRQNSWIRAGRWDGRGARPSRLLPGSTLGIIGLGRIGRALARRVSGFDLTLLVNDPYVDAATIAAYGGQKVDLAELLQRSDFISAHCPLNDETYHLLSYKEFELMKPGAFIVNTSRGPVIDTGALVAALQRGHVWGAGLDVHEQEPLPSNSPLREFDTVTLTPHSAASSEDSRENLYRTACDIVIAVRDRHWPPGIVNPEVKANQSFFREDIRE